MKKYFLSALIFTACALLFTAQSYVYTPTNRAGAFSFQYLNLGALPILPQAWTVDQEFIPPGNTFDVTRTVTTFAQLQQEICDWVAAPDQWWLAQIPHGTAIDLSSAGYTCTQAGSTGVQAVTLLTKIVGGHAPTKFFVINSDTPLPTQQTVCSGGISDSAFTREPPSGAGGTWWTGGNNGCSTDIASLWTLSASYNPGNKGLLFQAGPWDNATNIGPSHYAVLNAQLQPDKTNGNQLIVVNTDVNPTGALAPTLDSQRPAHIHFRQIYGHADATDAGPGTNKVSVFFRPEGCQSCSLAYSYIDYTTASGVDSHTVGFTSTAGPMAYADNYLSGSSEAFLTGGASSANALYYVRDLFVVNNRLSMPPAWVGLSSALGLNTKNRLELKVGQRVLIWGNIIEYSDTTAQDGQLITLTPRNCSAGAVCDNYTAVLQDITVENNIFRHAFTGIETDARSNYPGGNGGGVTLPLRRASFINNLFYDLGNQPTYDPTNHISYPFVVRPVAGGEGYPCSGSTVTGVLRKLTCLNGPTGLRETGIAGGDMFSVTNCADPTWNMPGSNFGATRGAIAATGTDPTTMVVLYNNALASTSSTTGCVVGNALGGQPNFNFVHNTVVAQSTANNKNNFKFYAGASIQLFTDTGCGGAGPTNSTNITAISRDGTGTIVTATVGSTTGWPAGVTSGSQVLAEVSGSGSDFNGAMYYLGIVSGKLTWYQQGSPNEVGTAGGAVAQMGNCPANMFNQGNVWKDNLLAVDVGTAPSCPGTPSTGWGGWATSAGANVEGCPSGPGNNNCSENIVDPATSIVNNTDFPGRCSAKYAEVGGAHAGALPPVTLTFPAATVCSGATATSGCVGMADMMNGVAFNNSDSSYTTGYALVSSSQYKAGGSQAADDGTDLGANIAAINTAQTTQFSCSTPCGAGPSPY